MIASLDENTNRSGNGWESSTLWTGPSVLTTIRSGKARPFDSLLRSTFKESTAFKKRPRRGVVYLGHMGFEDDEHAYIEHQHPARAVLQYNPNHYPEWKRYLTDIKVQHDNQRDALLEVGGFGENIAVENSPDAPPMDETTMCIGDLVGFQTTDGTVGARIRVNGPRMPCYKINHRFGIPNMAQWTQDKGWTGWLYEVDEEGPVQVGYQMILLDRPFPRWPVARVQHYCFKEPRNFEAIREALDTLGDILLFDVKKLFEKRLAKGVEDMSKRLKGDVREDVSTEVRLVEKTRETDRVSEFIFERVNKIPEDSSSFALAKSGSHVQLRLKIDGQVISRPYSVISGNSNRFHLGIALANDSRGGSAYMHQVLKVNDVVQASENFTNSFVLETQNAVEHIFLAGGIGITAFLDHIRFCLETKQKFHLHYMIRNESDYAFKTVIEKMFVGAEDSAKVTVYISANGHRCNLKRVLTGVARDQQTHVYVCGSEKLAEDVKAISHELKIPDTRIHREQFGVDATGDPFTAKINSTKREVQVNNRQSLLDALRAAGMEMASSCEAGNCGTCRIRVKCGRVLHKGVGLMDDEKAGHGGKEDGGGGEMLACVSRGVGTITLDL